MLAAAASRTLWAIAAFTNCCRSSNDVTLELDRLLEPGSAIIAAITAASEASVTPVIPRAARSATVRALAPAGALDEEVASAVAASLTTAAAKAESAEDVETWLALIPSKRPLAISISIALSKVLSPRTAKSAADRFELSFTMPSAPASNLLTASTRACSSAALVGVARPDPIRSFSRARLFAVTPVIPAAA